jgi:hypothetical protein
MYAPTAVNNASAGTGIFKPALRCQQNLDARSNQISVVDMSKLLSLLMTY